MRSALFIIIRLILCLQLIGQRSIAQEGHVLFSPVEGRQQLNEEQIRNITQLPDGRLVVITEGMLNIYDGAGFRTVAIDDESVLPLSGYKGYHHTYIAENRLWFKNMNRLAVFNLTTEQNETNPQQVLKELGIEEVPVNFFADSRQNIWVITARGQLLCHDHQRGKTYTFDSQVTTPQGTQDAVYDIISHQDKLYIFYQSGLMRCYDQSTARERYRQDMLPANKQEYGATLYVVPVGQYLYQIRNGAKGQLIRFDTKTRQTTNILQTAYWLNYLAADAQGNYWVACREGLWYFKAGASTGRYHRQLQLTGGSKVINEVSTIYYDQQGGLWAGTLNKGLYYYHPARVAFQEYGRSLFRIPEQAPLEVTCFEEMPAAQLLIGTRNGLYTAPQPLSPTTIATPVLPNMECHALLKDRHGTLWVATSRGVYAQDAGRPWQQRYPDDTRTVYETSEGTIYIGTAGKGLLQWNDTTKTFTILYMGDQLPGIKQVTRRNNKLIGISAKGPFIIDTKNQAIDFPLQQGANRTAMFRHTNHQYTCLLPDADQLLWMGTYDGLTIWEEKHGRLYRLHTEDGLVNNSIKAIVEDKDHTIWVTTARGISHIYKIRTDSAYQFRIVNYNSNNGVIQHTFAERSAFITSGATLLTGGVDGMNVYQPKPGKKEPESLSPVLLQLKLAGRQVDAGKAYNEEVILPRPLTGTDTLVLPYDQRFISITYSALHYTNPSQTWYRYRLEGVDTGWHIEKPANRTGETGYANLSPGKYRFTVQASADGLYWTGKPRTLLVIIRPPFWKTIYAYLFYSALSIALVGLIVRQRSQRNRRLRQREQTAIIETDPIQSHTTNLSDPGIREVQPDQIAANPPDEALLERALQCVQENLSNPAYSVEKFSMDMHMDRTGLYRKLMALTGQSPTNFIRTIRLRKAATLLLAKKQPVSEIATEVGFNSVSYFTKCFHETYGVPPSQYEGETLAGHDKV